MIRRARARSFPWTGRPAAGPYGRHRRRARHGPARRHHRRAAGPAPRRRERVRGVCTAAWWV